MDEWLIRRIHNRIIVSKHRDELTGRASAYRVASVAEGAVAYCRNVVHEWCEPAFRLLYKNMVTHGQPQDTVRYFRLMHAMGYRPPDHSWWDRFLQFHFYKQHAASREADGAGLMTQEMEQIRQAVAAVMAAPLV